jgi:hypothetical protein
MLTIPPATPIEPDRRTRSFYVRAMRALDRAHVPYVVGGGYALAHYTGISRNTKDLDLFIRPADKDRALTTLTAAGHRTEFFYPFWIAKAIDEPTGAFIDLIYCSGNGQCEVDDDWLTRGDEVEVLGHPTRLVPPEEQLWSKAFVQDRDRFDGADVAHLMLARGQSMDWDHLLRRFTGHEAVLLAHLVLFEYIYPTEREKVPSWVKPRLLEITRDPPPPEVPVCRGTNLAQKSYTTDIDGWGLADARVAPFGPLTKEQVAQMPDV